MGHVIKLGLPGALRDYTTEPQGDGIAWERGPANPFAARVNTTGKYDRVDIWNDWAQEDWQAGTGRVDPEAGGFLYAETETRVPGQIILPPLLQVADLREITGTIEDCRYMPDNVAGVITGTSGITPLTKYYVPYKTPAALPSGTLMYYFYARLSSNAIVTFELATHNPAGQPGSTISGSSTAAYGNSELGNNFYWYGVPISGYAVTPNTQYWLGIWCGTGTMELAYGSSGYDQTSWKFQFETGAPDNGYYELTGKYLLYATNWHKLERTGGEAGGKFFRFAGNLYHLYGEQLHRFVAADNNWVSAGAVSDGGEPMGLLLALTTTGDITSTAIFGPTVYFGRSAGNYITMDVGEVWGTGSAPGKLFLEYDGYLYRAWENDLYYTVDGSTWSEAFTVGSDDSEIRGMAGMGDSLYMATDKALYRFAPGEIVEESTRFGGESADNGIGMIEYQGALYIPVAGRVLRYDQSGQMMDVWMSAEGDLPNQRAGRVAALARMNNWLVAYVAPTDDLYWGSVWAWQEEGWHFLGLTQQVTASANNSRDFFGLYYDRGTQRLWYSIYDLGPYYLEIKDYTINPYNQPASKYQAFGWIEQDKFYGGQYLLNKSWESVTVVGDNLSTNVHVKVYFQDEGSTAWELLGTVDSDGEELRWSNYSTRPEGKWVKIGLLLQTNTGTETPRIRAIVVKFLPFPNDRISDSITITLKDYIQMPDGDPSDYTLAQQRTHIESLIGSVDPIIYQDPFGTKYEVAITSWRFVVTRFEHRNNSNVVSEIRVPLVLEQLPDTTYAGS